MPFNAIQQGMEMALLGIDIRNVNPASFGGREPTGPNTGFRTAAYTELSNSVVQSPNGLPSRKVRSLNGVPIEVPVYQNTTKGRNTLNLWPCITVDDVGIMFAPQRYVDPHDRFVRPVQTSMKQIALSKQAPTTYGMPVGPRVPLIGPTLTEHRDNPMPYDLLYEVAVWAKDQSDLRVLQHMVIETFPARGFLLAFWNDGTIQDFEMALHEGPVRKIDNQVYQSESTQQGEMCWVYTYLIEAFFDNTLVYDVKRTIESFDVELETLP